MTVFSGCREVGEALVEQVAAPAGAVGRARVVERDLVERDRVEYFGVERERIEATWRSGTAAKPVCSRSMPRIWACDGCLSVEAAVAGRIGQRGARDWSIATLAVP